MRESSEEVQLDERNEVRDSMRPHRFGVRIANQAMGASRTIAFTACNCPHFDESRHELSLNVPEVW